MCWYTHIGKYCFYLLSPNSSRRLDRWVHETTVLGINSCHFRQSKDGVTVLYSAIAVC